MNNYTVIDQQMLVVLWGKESSPTRAAAVPMFNLRRTGVLSLAVIQTRRFFSNAQEAQSLALVDCDIHGRQVDRTVAKGSSDRGDPSPLGFYTDNLWDLVQQGPLLWAPAQ